MTPLAPGSTIGILGGGQLGRMLALSAARLGFETVIYEPEANAPATRIARRHFTASWQDKSALTLFARECDAITLEFENVPVATLKTLAELGRPVLPGPEALAIAQDRFLEKSFLNRHGISTTRFEAVDGPGDLAPALHTIGGTGVLKTRREGYDGKGQAWLSDTREADMVWHRLGGVPCIIEEAIRFQCEISVIAARGRSGEMTSWAPPRNEHVNGILSRASVPSGLSPAIESEARRLALHLIEALDYVGVLALEFFVLEDGRLLANEFAPRVHNSGHWTPEACITGQFEQHIRCVAGWPLGATRRLFDVEMINLIGAEGHIDPASLAPSDTLTLYGKRETRPGRKMGHIVRRLGLSAE
jgi:5-(carboxyamino)imidazole ribonucleotide synthase